MLSPRSVATLIALAALTFAAVPAALACSCAPPPEPEKALAAAALVVEGTVLEGPTPHEGKHRYTFEVKRTWKGTSGGRLIIETPTNGAACGRTYAVGNSYFLYVGTYDGQVGFDSLCSRTRPMDGASEDIAALGDGTPVRPASGDDAPDPDPDPEATPQETPADDGEATEAEATEAETAEPETDEATPEPETDEPSDPVEKKPDCSVASAEPPALLLLLLPLAALARRRQA